MKSKHVSLLILVVAFFIATTLLMGFSSPKAPIASAEQLNVELPTVSDTIDPIVCVTYALPAPPTETPSETPTVEAVEVIEPKYSEDDLDLLARLLTAEVGCSWIPDHIQLYVGSVVLNRMASDLFPDTLYDVIYQEGQYSPTWNGSINNTPDERTIENARTLLEDGSVIPENVLFQANFIQGNGVYESYYDSTLGTTTYFCYGNS